jgi:shikimate dehydrogenase
MNSAAVKNPARYAVIGHPIGHSRSPFIHQRFGAQTARALSYETIDATPAQFASSVAAFFAAGGQGLNITVPHKEAALTVAHALTERARHAGAINTLALQPNGQLLGDNTDGVGLLRDLERNQHVQITGRRVLVLGAGGAARGILAPLLEAQPSEVALFNRTAARAHELLTRFGALGPLRVLSRAQFGPQPFDVVINATAASLAGVAPDLPAQIVNSYSICYDLAYGPQDTAFMRWAQQRGCARTIMGLGMLVEQAAESFYLWHGLRPDTASVLAELGAALRNADS